MSAAPRTNRFGGDPRAIYGWISTHEPLAHREPDGFARLRQVAARKGPIEAHDPLSRMLLALFARDRARAIATARAIAEYMGLQGRTLPGEPEGGK